ncbi:hypothetical protein Misp04_43930 [Micromonospora sp. NBRC 101691]|nr:hypothetical protein Misp04_43930 [Micromonospora sp. NBRC 101691]
MAALPKRPVLFTTVSGRPPAARARESSGVATAGTPTTAAPAAASPSTLRRLTICHTSASAAPTPSATGPVRATPCDVYVDGRDRKR